MFRFPTVLVVGAGASKPFGLPLASELLRQICERPPSFNLGGIEVEDEYVKRKAHDAARLIASSGQGSIDQFLSRPEQKGLVEWGKRSIAHYLLKAEADAVDHRRHTSDWHQWLFQRIMPGRDLLIQNLTVVTFNYDRLFQASLIQMLHSTLSMPWDQAESEIKRLPVFHVYGRLSNADLADMLASGRWDTSPRAVVAAAKGIRLISEERASTDTHIQAIREVVRSSHHIYFLGFGYDPANLRMIGIDPTDSGWSKGGRRLSGTAIGLRAAERARVIQSVGTEIKLCTNGFGCLDFLREHV